MNLMVSYNEWVQINNVYDQICDYLTSGRIYLKLHFYVFV